jgi:HTH-type transcriptional regulator/antitoxin MqsA
VSSSYRGHTIAYLQLGEWCDCCEEGILSGSDALATQERLVQWREKIDRTEARELASIRRRLKLTQGEAAEIAGGGKNAFSRYEKGQANPVRGVSVLFKLLDRHPELLTEAREFALP